MITRTPGSGRFNESSDASDVIPGFQIRRIRWFRALPLAACITLVFGVMEASGQTMYRIEGLVHTGILKYNGTIAKNYGMVGGAYLLFGYGANHALEAAVDRSRIRYESGWNLDQSDVTLVYSYTKPTAYARIGAHLIATNDALSDGTWVVFGGAGRRALYRWNAGLDAAYSRYPDYLLETRSELGVVQAAPYVALRFADAGAARYLYTECRGTFIRLSDEAGLGQRTFISLEGRMAYTFDVVTITVMLWSGERAFSVARDGFVVYNLSEKHTGGYGLSARYVLNRRLALTIGLYREQFREFDYESGISMLDDVNLTFGQLTLGVSL